MSNGADFRSLKQRVEALKNARAKLVPPAQIPTVQVVLPANGSEAPTSATRPRRTRWRNPRHVETHLVGSDGRCSSCAELHTPPKAVP